jgi:hypothetical protein
VIPPRIKESAD